jgi:hypothetical protein
MALWRNPNPVLNTNWRADKDFSGSQCIEGGAWEMGKTSRLLWEASLTNLPLLLHPLTFGTRPEGADR